MIDQALSINGVGNISEVAEDGDVVVHAVVNVAVSDDVESNATMVDEPLESLE